ncbi:MAG: hypothetical protein KGI54_18250 [Pseudomonadota bacterium]|nr:hypothetical protein [Pseudomonadota bacterium]
MEDNHIYNDPQFLGIFPDPDLLGLLEQLEGRDMTAFTLLMGASENLYYLTGNVPPILDGLLEEILTDIRVVMGIIVGKWYNDDDD